MKILVKQMKHGTIVEICKIEKMIVHYNCNYIDYFIDKDNEGYELMLEALSKQSYKKELTVFGTSYALAMRKDNYRLDMTNDKRTNLRLYIEIGGE